MNQSQSRFTEPRVVCPRPAVVPVRSHVVVWLLAAGFAVAMLAGCSTVAHHDLEERTANEVVVVLAHHDVVARKRPASDGRWDVVVPSTQLQRSLSVLASRGLPRREADLDAMLSEGGGLVPSAEDERARRLRALESDLEATFLAMDGIVDARVHAVVPAAPDGDVRSGASVLLVYRVGASPPGDEAVRAIVGGAIDGVAMDAVAIVRSETVVRQPDGVRLVAVGPFAVAESSSGLLRVVLAGLSGVVVLLATTLILLLRRSPEASS